MIGRWTLHFSLITLRGWVTTDQSMYVSSAKKYFV